jgi:hypothetical protein
MATKAAQENELDEAENLVAALNQDDALGSKKKNIKGAKKPPAAAPIKKATGKSKPGKPNAKKQGEKGGTSNNVSLMATANATGTEEGKSGADALLDKDQDIPLLSLSPEEEEGLESDLDVEGEFY